VVAHVAADPSVPRGSAELAYNQPDVAASELIDAFEVVTDVRVETIDGG
jgi:hypothetical protein